MIISNASFEREREMSKQNYSLRENQRNKNLIKQLKDN